MYHDPFAGLTNQPRIPDGISTDSLGHSLKSVFQTSTLANAGNGGAGDGIVHILVYGGVDACVAIMNDSNHAGNYTNLSSTAYTVGLADGINLNWSGLTAASGGIATYSDAYAHWRLVSAGLHLQLLNVCDEDDGWWEACRVHHPFDCAGYKLGTKNGDLGGTAKTNNGTVTPQGIISGLKDDQIVNQPSYVCGALRDIHKTQFTLNPIKPHDLIGFSGQQYLLGTELPNGGFDETDLMAEILNGSSNGEDLVKKHVDLNHDMIYIRLHGRAGTGSISGSTLLGTAVSNQEVVYDNNSNLARYMKPSEKAKVDMQDQSHRKRQKTGGSAAQPVSSFNPGN